MRRIISSVLVVCVMAMAPALSATAASAPRCKPELIAELDLAIAPGGTPLIPLAIDGQPVWLELQTSRMVTLLQERAIERLHLKTAVVSGVAPGVNFGGASITRRTVIAALVAGSFRYSTVHAGIRPGTADVPLIEVDGKPVVGSFGMEVLSRTDFELHLAAKKLRLFAPEHCRGVGAYWAADYGQTSFGRDQFGSIFFAVELDGKLVEAGMSTGSRRTSLDGQVASDTFGVEAKPDNLDGGDDTGSNYHTMTMHVAALRFSDLRLHLHDGRPDCGVTYRLDSGRRAIGYGKCLGPFPVFLGRDVLDRLRIYVALRDRNIYITEAGAGT